MKNHNEILSELSANRGIKICEGGSRGMGHMYTYG